MTTFIIVILVLVVAFFAFVATRPDTFTVKRSLLIRAKPAEIYPLIANFQPEGWGKWSPWEDLDPDLRRAYSGPPSGVGAIYEWEGNKRVGAGRMEIHHADAPSSVDIKLDFLRPFNATASHDEHLRILLSRMYEFNRAWLPVLDAEQVFLGEVTQESIAAYLSSGRSRGAKTSIVSPAEAVVS